MKTAKPKRAPKAASKVPNWNLRLYVAGDSPKCMTALANLRKICDRHIGGQYSLEVIDLLKSPQMAQGHQILAVPTLVRTLPQPIRKIIGDLSDSQRVIINLNITELD